MDAWPEGQDPPHEFDPVGEVEQINQELYGDTNRFWTARPAAIRVCWENATNTNYSGTNANFTVSEATVRGWVRDTVERGWQRYARILFWDWRTPAGGCTSSDNLRIRIGPLGTGGLLGTQLNGVPNGLGLTFNYGAGTQCMSNGVARYEQCIRAHAAHEFGHVLGFYHEEERPGDSPVNKCGGAPLGELTPGTKYGAYDLGSVMSYCGQPPTDSSTWRWQLGSNDIAAIQRTYGRHVSGQLVSPKGDCFANNVGNGNRAFIWDCDEANGQRWAYNRTNKSLAITSGSTACADLTAGVTTNGTKIQAWNCLNNSNQKWVFENVYVRGWGGICLYLPNGTTTNGTSVRVGTCGTTGDANHRWSYREDGTIRFGGWSSTKCLTAPGSQGQSFFIWTCDGAADQIFTLNTNGSVRFTLGGVTRCMDVLGPSDAEYITGNGLPAFASVVQSFGCNTSLNQQWNFSGPVRFDANKTKCIDNPNSSNQNGTEQQIWTCNGTDNQLWDFYFR